MVFQSGVARCCRKSCEHRQQTPEMHVALVKDLRQNTEVNSVISCRMKHKTKQASGSHFLTAFFFLKQINLNALVTSGWFLGNLFLGSTVLCVYFVMEWKIAVIYQLFFKFNLKVILFDMFLQAVVPGGIWMNAWHFSFCLLFKTGLYAWHGYLSIHSNLEFNFFLKGKLKRTWNFLRRK